MAVFKLCTFCHSQFPRAPLISHSVRVCSAIGIVGAQGLRIDGTCPLTTETHLGNHSVFGVGSAGSGSCLCCLTPFAASLLPASPRSTVRLWRRGLSDLCPGRGEVGRSRSPPQPRGWQPETRLLLSQPAKLAARSALAETTSAGRGRALSAPYPAGASCGRSTFQTRGAAPSPRAPGAWGRGRASADPAHTRAALAGSLRIVRRERGVPEPLRWPPRQEDRARRDGGSLAGSGLGTAVSAATAASAAAVAAAAPRRVRDLSGPRGPGAAQPAPALLQPGRGGEDLGHRHLRGAGARRHATPARALLQVGGGAHRPEQRPYHPGKVPGPSRAGSLPARASHPGRRGRAFSPHSRDPRRPGRAPPTPARVGDPGRRWARCPPGVVLGSTASADAPLGAGMGMLCPSRGECRLRLSLGLPRRKCEAALSGCIELWSCPASVTEVAPGQGLSPPGLHRRPSFEALHLPDLMQRSG